MNIFDFNRYLNVYIGSTQISCKINKSNAPVIMKSVLPKLVPAFNSEQLIEPVHDILSEASKKYKFKAINVVLADPLLLQINIILPSIPRQSDQLRKLVLLKIEKDYQLDKNDYIFSIQKTKNKDGINRFIVYAVKNDLLNIITGEVKSNNKVLRSVIPSYQLIHNATIAHKNNDYGAILYIDKESWTLSIVDKNNEIMFLRSKWHENDLTDIFNSISVVFRSLSNSDIYSKLKSASFIGDEYFSESAKEYLNSVVGMQPDNLNKKSGIPKELQILHTDLIYNPILAFK